MLGDASKVDVLSHLDYLKLQSMVNSNTSPCPTYLEACGRLNINPSDPILAFLPGTKIPPRLRKMERRLKPWQVQFLAGQQDMEDSALKSWLLGDEMGLGKTLAALARLIESARAEISRVAGTHQGASTAVDLPDEEEEDVQLDPIAEPALRDTQLASEVRS